ncbi:uncharacterized protein LOC125505364 isoform X2 [Dendroctonus ponderosae]|uniref:uncharacterized protein LOC125505364 isoform X2 n=1 Tax=Dendroctonus ponderosae TaxID=77166 RepID=UPI0020360238|nr:uncharacterized protein LOC125505364 isoform X2 [Dendroctonus ponderosae]
MFTLKTDRNSKLRYLDDSRHMFDLEVQDEIDIEEQESSHIFKLEKDASDATLTFKVDDNLENPEYMQTLNTNATEELDGCKCNVFCETFVLVSETH